MKLSIDISELIQLGKKMLPEGVDFFLDESLLTLILQILSYPRVKKLVSKDLDHGSGLISYHGRRVLLYIRDHSGRYDAAIVDGEKGKRFHIARCRTLDEMRHKNRFERYHATNRIDGLFEIDDGSGRSRDVDLRYV